MARQTQARARVPAAAFTLLEILLAAAITLLILGVVFTLYQTATRVALGRQARQAGPTALAGALQTARQALQSGLNSPAMDLPAFVLEEVRDQAMAHARIAFNALAPAMAGSLSGMPCRVTLTVAAGPDTPARLQLLRQPLAGPGAMQPPVTNDLLAGVAEFKAQVSDGATWYEQWPQEELPAWPQAIRIQLARQDTDPADPAATASLEIWLPAGARVESQLERQAAPAGAAPAP